MAVTTMNHIHFNKNFRVLQKGDKVILGNIFNGLWVKCPDYVFDFLMGCVKKHYTDEAILRECLDVETSTYMQNLIDTLSKIDVLQPSGNKEISEGEIDCVTIELTTGCNLRCSHCCVDCGEIPREDMAFEEIKHVIHWSEEHKVSSIALTGGEIFIRKDIFKIIHEIKQNFSGKVELLTNGTLIKRSMIPELVKLVDSISLSLDGYDEQSTSEIRGPGVFQKVMDTISQLKQHGFHRISLSMVLMKGTTEHANTFRELCSSIGVEPVLRVFSPEGRADSNYSLLSPQYRNLQLKPDRNYDWANIQDKASFKCICNQTSKMFVCANGDIYSCFLTKKPNNLLGTIKELLSNNLNSVQLMPLVDSVEQCQNCDVRYFCASACPGHDSSIFLNEEYRREMCGYAYPYYNQVVWQ